MSIEAKKPSAAPKADTKQAVPIGVLLTKVLDSERTHTSFGKLSLGDENSAPQFSFGTEERFNTNKFYLPKELATQPNGKWSPGPAYQVNGDAKYDIDPKRQFGTSKKNPLDIKAPYHEKVATDDTITADQTRKLRCLAPKFGTAPRFPVTVEGKSADHQYYPERLDFKKASKYSLGSRRENEASVLTVVTSTPKTVGPATYMPECVKKITKFFQGSKWTFPQAPRQDLYMEKSERNQTYDTRRAIGKQTASTKRTVPQYRVGTETRDGWKKDDIHKESQESNGKSHTFEREKPQLKSDIDSYRTENAKLKKDLEKSNKENQKYLKDIGNNEAKVKEANSIINTIKEKTAKIEELERKLKLMQEEKKPVIKEIENFKKENDNLANKLKELQSSEILQNRIKEKDILISELTKEKEKMEIYLRTELTQQKEKVLSLESHLKNTEKQKTKLEEEFHNNNLNKAGNVPEKRRLFCSKCNEDFLQNSKKIKITETESDVVLISPEKRYFLRSSDKISRYSPHSSHKKKKIDNP